MMAMHTIQGIMGGRRKPRMNSYAGQGNGGKGKSIKDTDISVINGSTEEQCISFGKVADNGAKQPTNSHQVTILEQTAMGKSGWGW